MEHEEMPIGFLSYSTEDNRIDNGAIEKLRADLSDEIKSQTGKDFPIFMDRYDIKWGDIWEDRLNKAVASASFFFPILSPLFFESEHCKQEVEWFLDYEAKTGRKDLMVPILYIAPEWIEKPHMIRPDLASRILNRQYVDWTKFRIWPDHSSKKGHLEEMALQIRDSITRTRNLRESRSEDEYPYAPRSLGSGKEHNPKQYGRILSIGGSKENDSEQIDPIQQAIMLKQQGRYEEAMALHDSIIKNTIDWDTSIGRLLDFIYFSISLHDKLEEWKILDVLDTSFYRSSILRLSNIVTASAFAPMVAMYEASLSLAMLRQTRLAAAHQHIERALRNPPSKRDASERHILHANALITRGLIHHADWVFCGRNNESLRLARADVDAANLIYRAYAKLGQVDEFHHMGRFYGTSSFILIAERKATNKSLNEISDELLDLAARAHDGQNRTTYGRIAGKYCHAYCLFQIALERGEGANCELISTARDLLKQALDSFDDRVALGRLKVARLLKAIGEAQEGKALFGSRIDFNAQEENALQSLLESGFQEIERVNSGEWLDTPLN